MAFEKIPMTPQQEQENEKAIWYHVIPFVLWLVFLKLELFPPHWNYAFMTVFTAALLLGFRPWRWYDPLKLKSIPWAVLTGVLVTVMWVFMEHNVVKSTLPGVTEFYERYLVGTWPIGVLRDTPDVSDKFVKVGETLLHQYDPKLTGWPLFWVHMFGTSVVVGVFEEFFWRGFLYRWMLGAPFIKIPLGRFNWKMWVAIALMFSTVHVEWFVAILCGLIYGLLIIKTRDIWAGIIAHALTNFLLGLYAVHYGYWQFW